MVIYYTGTGNSRYIAEGLSYHLGDEILDATDMIRRRETPELYSESPWIFVCPIYAWRLPRIFSDWIERTDFKGCRNAYFIITCGSEIGNAKKYLSRLCEKKNFSLRGVGEIVMPENYVAMFDVPDETTAARIRKHADRMVKKMSAQIAGGETLADKKITLTDKIKSSVVNPIFYPLFVKSKAFRATEACISCGKCEKGCPVGGIVMCDGRPEWIGNCTHCMACICGCPTSAIEYGKKSVGKVRYQCPSFAASDETK
ncbi:MAG: EFR1 family ferrodoxin [Clostridia bacterium]|nr:EFR1 family ferrodoxin [Clostridia bacterium]